MALREHGMAGTEVAADERRVKRAEVSRQQILDVAARLLRARGYAETSLRDIGAEVGMKAGSLYYHFPSKEALALEVLRIGIGRVHEAVVDAMDRLEPGASVHARLEAAIAAHLETLLVESDYTSAHIRCFPYVPPTIRGGLAQVRKDYEAVWRDLLDDAEREGVLAEGMDPGAARLALLGALNWSLEWFDPARGLPVALTRTLVAAFTRR